MLSLESPTRPLYSDTSFTSNSPYLFLPSSPLIRTRQVAPYSFLPLRTARSLSPVTTTQSSSVLTASHPSTSSPSTNACDTATAPRLRYVSLMRSLSKLNCTYASGGRLSLSPSRFALYVVSIIVRRFFESRPSNTITTSIGTQLNSLIAAFMLLTTFS